MIRIQQLRFGLDHSENDIIKKALKILKINNEQVKAFKIIKKSIDARKNSVKIIYTIEVKIDNEQKTIKRINNNSIMLTKSEEYIFNITGDKKLKERPIIIGTGPAGLFSGLLLAQHGYKPIIIERGKMVDERIKDINNLWNKGELNPNSNVQFGEGGAGTFSDGKLNTMVKDRSFRNKKVIELFVEAGAPSEILYINKPHIGTDYLRTVVKNIRKMIIDFGGDILFNTTLTDLCIDDNKLIGIEVNKNRIIKCNTLVLAIGHSARDTFRMLNSNGLDMISKSFAVGLRIEHPQILINKNQYGDNYNHPHLPIAEYKLTHKASNGRGVYSFCMCPGGFVVNASSEKGGVVTNGMSNYKRDETNANSALIVTVKPEDFNSNDPLSGVEFQRKWERKAFEIGGSNYKVPIQLFKDLVNNKKSTKLGEIKSSLGNQGVFANLCECLPHYVVESIKEGIINFNKKIDGFSRPDAVLSGVETRTSSPIRICRDDNFESNIKGIYPCGEGAGYAGGITSAAMDGIKVAENIASKYRPM
ncbi:MAG: NAD(P)/FAD-dependent oxidoreductase [Eubacteriales bacterium]